MYKNCLLFNVRKVEQRLTKLAIEAFKPLGIHPSYGYIMQVIDGEVSDVQIKDIAKSMGLSSSTITRMIDKLVDLGYVYRSSENKRVIKLTKSGEMLLPKISDAWDRFYQSEEFKIDQNIVKNLKEATSDFIKEIE